MTNKQFTNELEAKSNSAKESVHVTEERLKYLFTSSPGIIYCCKPSGDYGATFISENITSQLGYETHEFIEDPGFWVNRIHPEDKPHVLAGLSDLFEKGHHTHEYRFLHKDGSYRWMHDELNLIRDSDGNPIEIVGFWMDITNRKKMEEALQESENCYRLLAENATDVIWTVDMNLRFTYVSPSVELLRGYNVKEVMTQSIKEILTPTSYEVAMRAFQEALQTGSEWQRDRFWSRTLELELNCKDGSTVWTEIKMSFIHGPDGKPMEILGVTRDITERRKIREALRESEKRMQLLYTNLLNAQEAERKRISIELHDELGQALIVLKLQLGSIKRKLRKDQKVVQDECRRVLNYINQIIENVRRFSRDLRPYILEELGLTAAIRKLISDFVKRYKIKASIDIEDIDKFFSEKAQLLIYRILQEALTNIGKHSKATYISVDMNKKDDMVFLLIEDNGKGFNVKEVMTKDATGRRMGLATLKERARVLGGSLDIWSQEGRGSRLSFTIPVSKVEGQI